MNLKENDHAEKLFQNKLHGLNRVGDCLWTVFVEDSKSNHEQKQTSYIYRKSVSYVKVTILCCPNFALFELGF